MNGWDAACSVLKWHSWSGQSCIDTLNRLWAANPWIDAPIATRRISREGFEVVAESWPFLRFAKLMHPTQVSDVPPAATHHPVIVVRWEGQDYLVDGRRRINKWRREENAGPHAVLVIRPAGPETA